MRPSLCFNIPFLPVTATHTDARTIDYGSDPIHAARQGIFSLKYIIFDRIGEKQFVFFAAI